MTTNDATLADLRATPDPRVGITAINLYRRPRTVGLWALKREAEKTLRDLQARGYNVDKTIRIMRAKAGIGRPYAITRLGDFGEVLVMARNGSWVAGRLFVERPDDRGAMWDPYEGAQAGETEPATFTHVTRTVRVAGQAERYRAKSNGSCGRWVAGDASVALCTCGWKSYDFTRGEAQAAARVHRVKVAARP